MDFLLCDRESLQPLLAIELDGHSHNRPGHQARDKFVDGVFAAAARASQPQLSNGGKLRAYLCRKAGLADEEPIPSPAPQPVAVVALVKEGQVETAIPVCPNATPRWSAARRRKRRRTRAARFGAIPSIRNVGEFGRWGWRGRENNLFLAAKFPHFQVSWSGLIAWPSQRE